MTARNNDTLTVRHRFVMAASVHSAVSRSLSHTHARPDFTTCRSDLQRRPKMPQLPAVARSEQQLPPPRLTQRRRPRPLRRATRATRASEPSQRCAPRRSSWSANASAATKPRRDDCVHRKSIRNSQMSVSACMQPAQPNGRASAPQFRHVAHICWAALVFARCFHMCMHASGSIEAVSAGSVRYGDCRSGRRAAAVAGVGADGLGESHQVDGADQQGAEAPAHDGPSTDVNGTSKQASLTTGAVHHVAASTALPCMPWPASQPPLLASRSCFSQNQHCSKLLFKNIRMHCMVNVDEHGYEAMRASARV